MAATTAFYGTLNALKSSISIIVDIDMKLTNLQKVMNEDTNFSNIMENARISAEKFGKTLSEVMDAYTEFARQGYKEQDLINLGDAGLITSNVGETSAAQAAQYLTSAMVQFKLETKDAMKVIDAWNNISNKNATTVEKLASGMAKAGATANSFGLDMNQLNAIIGTVTAATKQSGNEVGNFVKSALPRLLGKPAQNALKMLNVDFLDKKTGDMRNVMDIYEEIAQKVQNISKVEKAAVMEGLAGKQHISRMTAFLDNFDMYKKMLDESRNSDGSATKENEKYMKSLTARIALMKQSLEEIALSLGKAFLTEGFIQTLEVIKSLAHGFVGISNIVGGLPLILSTAGIAATLLSKNLQSVAIQGTVLNRMFTTLGITSKALQVTIASIGVGTALFAFGFALEQILKKMSEARERAEEFARKNKELTDSYKENRKDVQSLSAEYEILDKKIRSGVFDSTDIEKYKKLTAELVTLMPSLATGEDQFGNKIIGSNEALKSKIALLEKQTAIQEKADAAQKRQTIQDNYGASAKDLKSKRTSVDKFFILEDNPQVIMSVKELDDAISKLQDKISKGQKLSFGEKNELKNLNDLKDRYDMAVTAFDTAKISYQKSIMDMIDNNVKLDSSTSKTTKSMINDFTTFVATSEAQEGQITKVLDGVLNSVQNDKGFKTTLEGYSQALQTYQKSIDNGTSTDRIEQYRSKAVDAFTQVKNTLLQLAESNGLKTSDLNAISAQMDGMANSALFTSVNFDKLSQSTGRSVEELQANLSLAPQMEDAYIDTGDAASYSADSIDGETSALNDNSDAKLENMSVAQVLFGVTSDQIAQMENAVAIVQMLSDVENLSAQQKGMLAQATAILAAQYPQLNGAISDNIDWISTQVGYMSALGSVSGSNASTMIKNQNATTKATISQINQRIVGYQKEFAALSSLMKNIENAYETEGMSGAKAAAYANASKRLTQIKAELASAQASLVEVTYGSGVKTGDIKINKPSTKTNSGAGKGKKTGSGKSDSKDKKIEKTIDPFEDKLHDYDEDIKKSEAIQKRYKEGSKEWIAEEKKQIGFIEKKRKTVIAEKAALEKLLKTAKLDKDQKKEVNNRIKELTTSQEEYTTAIKENTQAIMENMVNAKIDAIETAYDKEIAAYQKKLDMMDEEEKKQDRINRKKEMQDAIDKAKSNTRYEYVDKNGKVQLTYDKAEVARLEKEKTDQEAEWKKEDERAKLEKQIAEAEVNRDKAIATLNKLQETYFKKSIKNADDMKKVLSQLTTALDKAFKGGLPKHHTGGISGGRTTKLGQLFNQMVNAKTDEQVSLLKKGEVIVNPMLPNVQSNLNKLLNGFSPQLIGIPSGNNTSLTFNNVTIQTENGATFLKDLDMHIRMNKN